MMGGAWLANLNGHQTVAIDRDAIRIVARTAARLSIYRPKGRGCTGVDVVGGNPCAITQ
jgi:hypothetical protein